MGQLIDRYSSPRALALVSNSPEPVCRLVFTISENDRESICLLRGERGNAILWEQRHAVSWVAREFIGASFPEIGRALNCDHTVIVRGYNRAKLLRRIDPDFRDMSDRLSATVQRAGRRRHVQTSAAAMAKA